MPLGHPDLLSNRPVNALAFSSPNSGEPLLLAAYGPVGAQLGAAELLKVRDIKGEGSHARSEVSWEKPLCGIIGTRRVNPGALGQPVVGWTYT